MITQAFTDLEKAITMLNRRPEVEDAPNAIEWKKQPRLGGESTGEIVISNVSFHYKMDSRQRALGTALHQANEGGGVGRHGLRRGRAVAGFIDEGSDKNVANGEGEEDQKSQRLGGVSNINIRVPAGKTAALVGPSGSGKTTLIRLLLRMYDTDDGSVLIDGHDVKDFTQQSLRQNIGVVAQDTILFNASLRDNITYGKEDATDEEVWAVVKTAALESFVMGLPQKLDTLVGERGMKLSGGERQRVGLARCIIKDPDLVLLDEATSALDSATEQEIQQNIANVCRGRTTLMIAHRLSTARRADEIIVLEKGSVVEQGSHEELVARTNGHYAKMWQLQTENPEEE
jgi:ABC-type multidrug transport system fused ATPase/permease subunit